MLNRATLAFCVAIAASTNALGQDAEPARAGDVAPSTPAAPGAVEVASKFMGLVFDRKMTVATVVAVNGDWVDVEARPFPQTTCKLKLQRAPLNNPDGWVVQTYTCAKARG